jgi:hypothetical protein
MTSTCGCCAGTHVETPRLVTNRPRLSTIAHRVGDYRSFKRSMLARLSMQERLSRLTRDNDDVSIALLDAFAMTADVITFYQERIANESYLRTAGERASVLELARLIGYELAPGVAASAWLAFHADDAEGAPEQVLVAAGTRVQSVPGQDELPQTFETSVPIVARAAWNELHPRTMKPRTPQLKDTTAWLLGTPNVERGEGLLFDDASGALFHRVLAVEEDLDENRTLVTWSGGLTRSLDETSAAMSVLHVQAQLFGHNAIDPRTLSPQSTLKPSGDEWDFAVVGKEVLLEGDHPEIAVGSRIVIIDAGGAPHFDVVTAVAIGTQSHYAITATATKLTVQNGGVITKADYRFFVVFAAPEKLPFTDSPLTGNLTSIIELDGAIPPPEVGRAVFIDDGGKPELAFVGLVDTTDTAHTKLHLTRSLAGTYDRTKARILANVAPATHGETFREVLGSGDASLSFQTFRLSHVPLTYVPTPSEPGGAGSTLSVFVNDILWHDVPTLYLAGPNARVYITRRDDDGATFVQFGDGKESGARLPTGNNNVVATYRKGLGHEGNVDAHKVMLLLTLPLGLESVDNPLRATGGTDPEQLADARRNAPKTVLTLDRVVSLLDYQSFAASFAGIAKALATWTLAGNVRQVFLTVAGPDGASFEENDPTLQALAGALVRNGHPYVPLRIASYQRSLFHLAARVGIEKDHIADVVLAQVRSALRDAFSFDARSFGQAVDLSDLIAVMHSADGVAFVDIDLLYRADKAPARNERLSAAMPRQDDDGPHPAEILILDLQPADIGEAR